MKRLKLVLLTCITAANRMFADADGRDNSSTSHWTTAARGKNVSGKEERKIQHVNEFVLTKMHLGYVPNNNVSVTITIRDAECFLASTTSSFSVHLAAIDFDNKFQSWITIESEHFEYDEETATRHFSGSFKGNLHNTNSLDECFEELNFDCAPRADAVFIRFDNQPEDAWAIDQIFVDTSYRLGPTEEHEQKWHFEHPVLMPCSSWLDDRITYQIGPRNGLFISRSYRYTAEPNEWIRDWEHLYVNELILKDALLGSDTTNTTNNDVSVTVTIRDAECFSASTTSSFTIHLASINFENEFQSWTSIKSEDFHYNPKTKERHFSGTIEPNLHGEETLDDCFEKLHFDCAPRADAVFIQFDYRPEDAWAIDEIFVDTSYTLGPTAEHEQSWHFEHPIVMPCSSWLDASSTYQIGPRNGLFIVKDYRYQASEKEWIRDWV
ncbi:hypothetical protein GCK32_006477 [Trichostrongylus colubriformis]|uniref:Uncharacterized protein n=1 Tax=Trichostrongylus colubriformis TaxID=6319 RepID=A0AAN8EN86_TRICO